jgi:hypothetical protein
MKPTAAAGDVETFALRVYNPQGPSNYHVTAFQRISDHHHRLALDSVAIVPGAIYQVYPGRARRCFYDVLPPGTCWYCMAKRSSGDGEWQQLAVIDTHDQYAYFTIPAHASELRWVRVNSLEELKTTLE